jgi:hypothetical protein
MRENMRRKQQQDYVRPITTGNVEADMLGQVYLWVSERSNRLNISASTLPVVIGLT